MLVLTNACKSINPETQYRHRICPEIETVPVVRLDITDRSTDAIFSQPFCVKGITSSQYTVIAYGSSQAVDAFLLANTNDKQLAYVVSYRGDLGKEKFDLLHPGYR